MSEIFDMALPLAEMTIIKRDFDLLQKIILNLTPDVQIQMTPYSALFCHEAIEYLNSHGEHIDIEQTSRYSIKDIRQKAKFFDLSINKLLQGIENVDELQNDYFVRLMRYPQLGYWNIHTNLGIYFDEEKNIVGNTHYSYYVFQDEKMITQPKGAMQSHELQGKEIQAFGFDMGKIIGSISSGFSGMSDFVVSDICPLTYLFHSQDFNTNRCALTGNERYKIIRLFLLHVLSSIGFVLFCLKKIIIRDTGLLLRLEYITFHYALKRLDGILRYCQNHGNILNDSKLFRMLKSIDYSNTNHLRKVEFRNCMMHFALRDKSGNSLIDENKLNLSLPFCGLIESQFDMTYEDYIEKIESELSNIYSAIKNYLGFELLLSSEGIKI